jgi:hypothetical protein
LARLIGDRPFVKPLFLSESEIYSYADFLRLVTKDSRDFVVAQALLDDRAPSSTKFVTYTRNPAQYVLGLKSLEKYWMIFANLGLGWVLFQANQLDQRFKTERAAAEAA